MENRFIHFGIVLGLIAAVSAGLLGEVDSITKGKIDAKTKEIEALARKAVLPIASTFKEEEKKKVEEIIYVPGYDEAGEIVGYVASVSEPGYGGNINFVVGIDKDAKVTGLNVVSHSETPGLGSKVDGKKWQEHWVGKDSTYKFDKSVDAFAGATISPNAVYRGTMKALDGYENEVSE